MYMRGAGRWQSLHDQSRAAQDVTFQLEVAQMLKTFGGWNDRQRNLFLARLYRKCYMPQVRQASTTAAS